jgi:hypothetical protein
MSNTIASQLTEQTVPPGEAYQRGFDDPATQQAVADAELVVATVAEHPAHPIAGSGEGHSQNNLSFLTDYRYRGLHRVRRDEPSNHDRHTLTPGDQDLRRTLHELRDDVYTTELARAALDGASEKGVEVHARSAAQAAVKDFYADVQEHRGVHRRSVQAKLSGRHQKQTLAKKAVEWLTHSPEEIAVREQRARDIHDLKHPVHPLRTQHEVFVPETVQANRSQVKPTRAERRYMQAVGAVDDGDFERGAVVMPGSVRAEKPSVLATTEQLEARLIELGARTPEEVFNEMYADRAIGGSTIYGGKILSENPGLLRKLAEAGTTHQDTVGPVERAHAQLYADRMAIVSTLESRVTDKIVPHREVIEAMLYPDADVDTLTDGQKLVIATVQERLNDLRQQKLRPGETVDARVRLDRTRPIRETWRSTGEALKGTKAKMQRAIGLVALHGAVWTAGIRTILPEPALTSMGSGGVVHHAHGPWSPPNEFVPSVTEPIHVYSPGELARLASTWTFVRAQMIAAGTLRSARDWFRPRDYETNERRFSMLRLAGAAAAIVTAASASYVHYKINSGDIDLNTVSADFSHL